MIGEEEAAHLADGAKLLPGRGRDDLRTEVRVLMCGLDERPG